MLLNFIPWNKIYSSLLMGFPELKKVIHGHCTPPPSPKPRERLNLNVLQFPHTHSLFYSNLIEWNLHFEYFLSWNIVFPLLRLMNFTSKASKPFKSPKCLMYWLSGSVVILSQLKACVRYFLLLLSPNDSPSKTMKNVFYFI